MIIAIDKDWYQEQNEYFAPIHSQSYYHVIPKPVTFQLVLFTDIGCNFLIFRSGFCTKFTKLDKISTCFFTGLILGLFFFRRQNFWTFRICSQF